MLLVDGPAIARDLGLHPVTIRKWAHAGYIVRHGTDTRGRAIYDLDEVQRVRDTPPAERRPMHAASSSRVLDYTHLQDHQSVHSPEPIGAGLYAFGDDHAAGELVIRSTFGRPRWWRVTIHATVGELQDAAYRHRPWLGRDHWADTEGCCHPAGRIREGGRCSWPRNGYCGIVRYARPSFTAEIVTHELVHAAVATLRSHGLGDIRLGDGVRGSNVREEQLAYVYGELYADLERQL